MKKIEKLEKLHYYLFFGLVLVFIGILIGLSIPQTKAFEEAYDKGYEDVEQIVDDFELVIELQQYYYQENITDYSFGDWLQINYPELYSRIESYF